MQKFRWSKVYESSEEELIDFLRTRKLDGKHVMAEAGDAATVHNNGYDVTLWCAEGSLSVSANGTWFSLQPGDALHVPAKTPYELTPGISGYKCYLTK